VIGAGMLALLLPAFIRYDGREGLKRKEAEESDRAAAISSAQNIDTARSAEAGG
jgi:hypothetical protein